MQVRSSVNKYTYDIQKVTDEQYYSTFIDENVLTTAYPFIKPNVQIIEDGMDFVASYAPSLVKEQTTLASYLGSARTIFVDAEYVEWVMLTKGSRRAEQVENINSGDCPGIGKRIFYLKLNVGWFKETDTLTTDRNSSYVVRIAENPQNTGDGWVYKVQLVTNDPEHDFFPPALLEPGIEWIKLGAPAGEASILYGSWQNDAMGYIKFRIPMSSHSQEGTITNKANRLVLRADPMNPQGKILKGETKILPIALMQFMQDFDFTVEKTLMFNRLSDHVLIDRSSNKGIQFGPGLLEIMEQTLVHDVGTNEPILDILKDAATELAFDRIPWEKRVWTVMSGTDGMLKASNEIQTVYNMRGYTPSYSEDVNATTSTIPGQKSRSFDPGTFNEITIPFVGTFRFEYWPLLDSEEVFRVKDPETGRPLASQYYFIWDFGLGEGNNSNIQYLQKRDEVFAFQCGTESPAGPINSRTGTMKGYTSLHKGRYYDFVAEKWFGIRMKDTARAALIRPNIC